MNPGSPWILNQIHSMMPNFIESRRIIEKSVRLTITDWSIPIRMIIHESTSHSTENNRHRFLWILVDPQVD